MELNPTLEIGWLNGWILLVIEFIVEGGLLLVFPKDVVTRLFDRSGWSKKKKIFTILGKIFSLVCLILIALTPLKIGSSVFVVGLLFYVVGLSSLVTAMFNFKDTPLDEPVTLGLYRISRHPQITALFVLFSGICLAIGSWSAFLALLISKLLQHFGILAEEEACLKRYGEPYRAYMERVPRYLLII
jgi:protein-S-isoprenylcysteine O-methyltransferase Ste14